VFPKDPDLAAQATQIWRAGVDAVLPSALIPRAVVVREGLLRFEGRGPLRKFKVPLSGVRRIAVVGAGKAGAGMAAALEEALGEELLASKDVHGIVNVPDDTVVKLRRIELHPARSSHVNHATEEGAAGARRIRELVKKLRREDVLIVLLSGGGSALLPAPVEGVTLEEKERLVRILQARGADIVEVNCVRKHLSQVKGGGLVAGCHAGLVVGLAISDVMGDPIDVIASGPTAPDPTTHSDALRILARYGIDDGDPDAPPACLRVLREGAEGRLPDTMKTLPERVKNLVVGGIDDAVRIARRHAEVLGWSVLASKRPVGGDTAELARTFASFVQGATANNVAPGKAGVCLISGGETTVKLGPRPGLGGRNQELVLGVLAELGTRSLEGACVLSGGTDGEDGPTDAAGAWADAAVARKAAALKLDPRDFLVRHDSYRFFEKAGGHVKTGFTGTNVMDLRVALVDPRSRRS
jgi:glycerate 2-kinase